MKERSGGTLEEGNFPSTVLRAPPPASADTSAPVPRPRVGRGCRDVVDRSVVEGLEVGQPGQVGS